MTDSVWDMKEAEDIAQSVKLKVGLERRAQN